MGGRIASFGRLGLIVLDVVLIHLSYLFTWVLRTGRGIPASSLPDLMRVVPWISIMAVLIFYLFGLYSDWIDKNLVQVIYSLIFSMVLLNLLAAGLIYFTRRSAVPPSVALLTPVAEMMVLTLTRFGIWALYRRHSFTRGVVVVGEDAEDSKSLAQRLLSHANPGFSLVALIYGMGDKEAEEIAAEIGRLGETVDIIAVSSGIRVQGGLVDYCIREDIEMVIVPSVSGVALQRSDIGFQDDRQMVVSANYRLLAHGSIGLTPNDRAMASANPGGNRKGSRKGVLI